MTPEKIEPWYDELPGAYLRNIRRMLLGVQVWIEGEEGQPSRHVTIREVTKATTGVDCRGIFTGLDVETTEGETLTFYDHGGVDNADNKTIGQHRIHTVGLSGRRLGIEA